GISEFRALVGVKSDIDPRFVRMLEQSTGFNGLKFETDPGTTERDMQPVLDPEGRIVGFFTWEADHPMTAAVNRLGPLLVVGAFGFRGFAGFSFYHLRGAGGALAESAAHGRRMSEEDALPGLPNRRKILALLNDAMAQRKQDTPFTFALFELAGLHDI